MHPGSARVGARPSRIAAATSPSLPGRARNRAKMNSSMAVFFLCRAACALVWFGERRGQRSSSARSHTTTSEPTHWYDRFREVLGLDMATSRTPASLLVRIDSRLREGLQQQIYRSIRRAILDGIVGPG